MTLHARFITEREAYLENLESLMGCLPGLYQIDDKSHFYNWTNVLGHLGQTGEYDENQSPDLQELGSFVETILPFIRMMQLNMNVELSEGAVTKFEQDILAGAFYIALFIVDEDEDGFHEAFQDLFNLDIFIFEGMAACLGLKPSTLKNHFKIGDLDKMTRQDIVAWLKQHERFKPFTIVDSRTNPAPYDCSNITTSSSFLAMLKIRVALFNKDEVWDKFAAKYLPENGMYDNFTICRMPFNKAGLFRVMDAANLDPDTIDEAIKNMRKDSVMDAEYTFDSFKLHYRQNLKSTLLNRQLTFEKKSLYEYLTNDRSLPVDADDSGKNNYLSAVNIKNITIGVEHRKVPSVWINKEYIDTSLLEGLSFKTYPFSEDKSGRHSALRAYSQLGMQVVINIKVPNSGVWEKVFAALLAPNNVSL
jgi:hypothetical protein